MKQISVLLLLLLTGFASAGQQITGTVTQQSDGKPLEYVTIVWMGTRAGTFTDANGNFITSQPPGATHLIFSYPGLQTDTVEYHGENMVNVIMREIGQGPVVVVEGHVPATNITGLNPQMFQVMGEKELCKAACCNLSESFETNASIDAAFTDAITGTRQIRMLGLEGKYTQMMFDNIPAVRGLASTYGLTYVPGSWVKNIYIAKGVGSVTSGYESITGQINVAFKNPDNAEKFYLNGYSGSGGRMELNVIWAPNMDSDRETADKPKKKNIFFHPVLLAHGAMSKLRTDMNRDGFLDNPLFSNVILRNEWHLETEGGLGGQFAASYLRINNVSGKLDYDPMDEIRAQLWGVHVTTDRYDASAKVGYVFPNKEWKSFGSQINASWHNQHGSYGFRQYKGSQLSARANLLFASRIKNDNHKFTTGISYTFDDYQERLYFTSFPPVNMSSLSLNRMETVPGVFVEYTWNPNERLMTIAGLRADFHNIYGWLITPRIHTRYSITERIHAKLLAGKGYRTPSLLMDNVGVLASNRNMQIEGNYPAGLFGLKMEEAWNFGVVLTSKFKLNHRDATLSLDVYRTYFVNQVVMDVETAALVRFYNLAGKSYSNSAQMEFHWTPAKRLEWRLAYRWLDVQTEYESRGLLERPLVNKHRAFTNLAFSTKEKSKGDHWRFDATLQWIGAKRIPNAHQHDETSNTTEPAPYFYSDDYIQLNAQVTYAVRKDFEFYIGGENLTNFMIHDAIVLAENPASAYFDASLVWGPVFGRMGYVGFRWSLK